jgi:beta-phosphoglucomutase
LDNATLLRNLLLPARGVVFDFDGVLADSERFHYLAYSEVFARYGHTIDEHQYYEYWTSRGLGARGEIERYALDVDPRLIMNEKNPIFSRYCRDGSIKLYDEAKESVRILAAAGKAMAIASGTTSADILAVLRNEGMEAYFPVIRGKDNVQNTKPDPEVFLSACEALGLEPRECVVLEDAEKGVRAARAAGIPVIVVRSPETRRFDFPDADAVVDSPAAMRDALRVMF